VEHDQVIANIARFHYFTTRIGFKRFLKKFKSNTDYV